MVFCSMAVVWIPAGPPLAPGRAKVEPLLFPTFRFLILICGARSPPLPEKPPPGPLPGELRETLLKGSVERRTSAGSLPGDGHPVGAGVTNTRLQGKVSKVAHPQRSNLASRGCQALESVRPESLGIFWCNREACKKHRIAIEVVKSRVTPKKKSCAVSCTAPKKIGESDQLAPAA